MISYHFLHLQMVSDGHFVAAVMPDSNPMRVIVMLCKDVNNKT